MEYETARKRVYIVKHWSYDFSKHWFDMKRVLLCQMSELGNVLVVLKLDEPVGGSLSSTEMGFVEQPHWG